MKLLKLKLHWQIIIALVAGGFFGALLPGWTAYTDWIGRMFVNALGMVVVPLIFSSIVSGVTGIADGANLKSIGLRTICYYVITMLIAVATGLTLVNLINPGAGMDLSLAGKPEGMALGNISFMDTIVNIVPSNIAAAFSGGNMLPVIFFAILFGVFVNKLGKKEKDTLTGIFDALFSVMIKITYFIVRFSPIGVFAIIARQIAGAGDILGLVGNLSLYVLTVSLGLAVQMFVWLPSLLYFKAKVNPVQHFRNMINPLVTAFSTASSNAALPLTIEAVEEKDGVSQSVASLTLPLGATINMNGTALLEGVAAIFIAQAYGIDLTFGQQVIVALTAVLAAVGSAGIPMAGIVMMSVVLSAVGLPLEGIGLVIGVDRIADMMRTSVDVFGDTCVAVMVAKDEGERLDIDLRR